MRQYEEIWTRLKLLPPDQASKVGVSITAPKYWHKRIIKAVKKEKHMDFGYKLKMLEEFEGKVATLYHSRNSSILVFYLRFNITAYDL